MANPDLIKSFRAESAIGARVFVKFGATDSVMTTATTANDLIVGVSEQIPAAVGQNVDVVLGGIADTVAGAAVIRGSFVTADGSGRAITAAPATGINMRIAGVAMASATAAGDIIPVYLTQGMIQGQ